MSNKSQSQIPGKNDGSNAIATNTTSKYTPQFSAATQMIIERIHSGNSVPFSSMGISATNAPPPGYEDMRRSVLQTMRTSMNLKIPVTPIREKKPISKSSRSMSGSGISVAASAVSTGSGKKGRTSVRKSRSNTRSKRKRIKDESEDSEEDSDENMSKLGGESDLNDSDAIPKLPKTTQSGRQIVKPAQYVPATYESYSRRRTPSRKLQDQALCKRCGRGHSPQNNMIVFCDGCNLPWHQNCHEPLISNDAVQIESALWYCADCSRKKGIKTGYETFPKGVSWAGKSMEEKKAYLNSQPHSQLVTLLMQATYLHPDIPLFPWPTTKKTHIHTQQTQSLAPLNSSSLNPLSRSEANLPPSMNVTRKKQSPIPQTNTLSINSSFTTSISSKQQRVSSRESTPASPPYPRPGNGLMAKLGPDDEDLDWLVDSDDYVAFSHSMVENSDRNDLSMNTASSVGTGIGGTKVSHRGTNINGVSIGV